MTPADQSAEQTICLIKGWARFAYDVSLGNSKLDNDFVKVAPAEIKHLFYPGARRVYDLMDYRNDASAKGIALGQILHIVQDSFSYSHVERDADGKVVKFLNYLEQKFADHKRHDRDVDEINAVLGRNLNPVAFGRELLALRARRAEPREVEVLLDRYFVLSNSSSSSQAVACNR
ncbi:MAG: hypothetical protein JNN20_05110 [Betaproteobacteria bacterium]|nr:hypothetical protein [Betaproteobacteria bacterium]